jgi:hypothetical protein
MFEPLIEQHPINSISNTYLFSNCSEWGDYFAGLKEHRQLVLNLFWKILLPSIKKQVDAKESPQIGIHVRLGDFRKLRDGENFKQVGLVRTPEEYFVDTIYKIRKIHGIKTPVSIFTDGHKYELEKLLNLDNISIIEGNSDIVDLLLLSKSKVIICSAGSTFSYWAGFLSDSPIILHPEHIHAKIRLEHHLFEGTLDEYILKFKNSGPE